MALPGRAQVVVIGGGVVGCSVAYHLALRGVTDVAVIEQRKLTHGSTWHAAGLIGQLSPGDAKDLFPGCGSSRTAGSTASP
jgi:sarcosine dehydrogenase